MGTLPITRLLKGIVVEPTCQLKHARDGSWEPHPCALIIDCDLVKEVVATQPFCSKGSEL